MGRDRSAGIAVILQQLHPDSRRKHVTSLVPTKIPLDFDIVVSTAPTTKEPGMSPRTAVLSTIVAISAVIPVQSASAQNYPTKPIHLIVPYPAGGGTDFFARLVGQKMSELVGQPIVIENKPGGGSNIATEAVVRAPPDGYTLLMVSSTNAINATLYEKLNYNFIRDIMPVAGITLSFGHGVGSAILVTNILM